MQSLGAARTAGEVEARRVAFVAEFISRQEFRALYGNFGGGAAVDSLLARAGLA